MAAVEPYEVLSGSGLTNTAFKAVLLGSYPGPGGEDACARIQSQITGADMRKDASARRAVRRAGGAITNPEDQFPNFENEEAFRAIMNYMLAYPHTDRAPHMKILKDYEDRVFGKGDVNSISFATYQLPKEQPVGSVRSKVLDSELVAAQAFAYHDSGMAPNRAISGFADDVPPPAAPRAVLMNLIMNVFDEGPGGATRAGVSYFPDTGASITLGPDIMRLFGYRNLTIQMTRLATGNYVIRITHNDGDPAKVWILQEERTTAGVRVSSTFNGAESPTDFFGGNPEKNRYIFDNYRTANAATILIIMALLACKALGDLVQDVLVMLHEIIMNGVGRTYGAITFSCDNVYSARALDFSSLRTAVSVFRQTGDVFDKVVAAKYHYRTAMDPAEKKARISLKNAQEQNLTLLRTLQGLVSSDRIKLSRTAEVGNNAAIKKHLTEVATALNLANERMNAAATAFVAERNSELFLKTVAENTSRPLYKPGNIPISNVGRLFMLGSSVLPAGADPIFDAKTTPASGYRGLNFIEQLQRMSGQAGGAWDTTSEFEDKELPLMRSAVAQQYINIAKDSEETSNTRRYETYLADGIRPGIPAGHFAASLGDVEFAVYIAMIAAGQDRYVQTKIEAIMYKLEAYFSYFNITILDPHFYYFLFTIFGGGDDDLDVVTCDMFKAFIDRWKDEKDIEALVYKGPGYDIGFNYSELVAAAAEGAATILYGYDAVVAKNPEVEFIKEAAEISLNSTRLGKGLAEGAMEVCRINNNTTCTRDKETIVHAAEGNADALQAISAISSPDPSIVDFFNVLRTYFNSDLSRTTKKVLAGLALKGGIPPEMFDRASKVTELTDSLFAAPTAVAAGGARKTRSRKNRGSSRKSRNNHKNKTRKGNNRKYNRRTRRRS